MQFTTLMRNLFRAEYRAKNRNLKRIQSTEEFYRVLERERCRTDRSGMPFSLVSFGVKEIKPDGKDRLQQLICSRMRLTDEAGWIDYQHLGLLLYNTNGKMVWGIVEDVLKTIPNDYPHLDYTIYSYPSDKHISADDNDELRKNGEKDNFDDIKPILARKMPFWKRSFDIFGALFGLILFSPVFFLISLLIKIVSPGPVFFIQERIGYGGKRFQFLKFRTMKLDSDPSAHQQYWTELINGHQDHDKPMVKLDDNNLQIIPFGKLIRNTYLDELPQLLNVLRGEMSMVGPRPPIPYEVEEYIRWHNGRFDIVPGMTGLWQVSGKNRLTFKEMVRMDIRYSRNLSFFSDMKILMKTPFVIISELIGYSKRQMVSTVLPNRK